jgi:hypothetical protein
VLKLKEYGKYVIGVGIRESASDLLVQNCDEYYSYSALTGLTRAGEEGPAVSEDPWELVEVGLRQMIENDDVMRSDRLKQVLLEMDPSFDEKALGFQKFNKFLQDAANRGIISLRKQENGQYEVGPPTDEAVEAGAEPSREVREGRSRRGRRGRGRRDERELRDRDPAREQLEVAEGRDGEAAGTAMPEPLVVEADAASEPDAEVAAPTEAAAADSVVEDAAVADVAPADARPERAARAPRRGRGARPEPSFPVAAEDGIGAPDAATGAADSAAPGRTDGIAAGYDLLRRAVSELVKKSGPSVRDSDVKRRMLEMQPGWDEAPLGFSKFSRFLRTAHEAEVITLRKGDNGVFDVLLGDGGVYVEPDREERGGRRDRGRGARGRDQRDSGPADEQAAVGAGRTAPAAAAAGATQVTSVAPASATPPPAASPSEHPAPGRPRETQATPPAAATPAQKLPDVAPAAAMGFRRGSRGRPAPAGPPPLLEGQAAPVVKPKAAAVKPTAPQVERAAEAAPAASPGSGPKPVEEPSAAARDVAEKSAAGKGEPRGRDAQAQAVAEAPAAARETTAPAGRGQSERGGRPAKHEAGKPQKQAAPPGKEAGQGGRQPAKQAGKPAGKPAAGSRGSAKPAVPAAISAVALGLPSDPAAIVDYMATNYKGVGPKSVQTLIDTFGAGKLYDALEKQHDRIIEVMGTSRGENLIDAFADDLAARRANAAPDSRSVVAKQAATGGRPAKKRGSPPAAGGGGARRGPPRGRSAGK